MGAVSKMVLYCVSIVFGLVIACYAFLLVLPGLVQATKDKNDPILYTIQVDHSKDLDVGAAFASGGLLLN